MASHVHADRLWLLQRLAHNEITSLKGLSALHGPDCSLSGLDLRMNPLTAQSQLAVLAGCSKLTVLQLGDGVAGTELQLESKH